MQFESLHCSICYNEYNLDNHIPRILPKCGHTICSFCLDNIMKHPNPKCPLDKQSLKTKLDLTKAFPVNFTVRSFLEESAEQEICTLHLRELKLICITDRVKVCKHCLSSNDHKDHNLKPIKEIKIETDNRRKRLELALANINEYHKELTNALKVSKANLSKRISDGFNDLMAFLQAKKHDVLFDLDVKFNREKKKVDDFFGEGSCLRKDIQSKIQIYEGLNTKKDFLMMIEANNLQALLNLDDFWLKESMGGFNTKVNEFVTSLEKLFNAQKLSFNNFILPQEDLVKSLKIDSFKESKNDLNMKMSEILSMDLSPLKLKSSIQINNNRELGFLEIISKGQSSQDTIINLNEWKDIKHVFVCLEEPRFNDEGLLILSHIMNKLDHVNTITLKADNQEQICEDGLSQLLTTLFIKPRKLLQIRISLNLCQIGDPSLIFISEKIIPRTPYLEKFLLSLKGTNISDKAIEVLAENLSPFAKNLTSFRINLGETKVTEKAVAKLFMSMPKTKKFMIGLDSIPITDDCLNIFIANTLSSMGSLEELYLDYQNTKITGKGITNLFEKLWSVASVRIVLEECMVTDKTVKALKQNKNIKPEELKSFNISLYNQRELKRVLNQDLFNVNTSIFTSGSWLSNFLRLGGS